jgi:thioredoxin reductase (NADPH)
MSDKTEQLIIIGSGPAGLTAAIYAARADLKPIVIEGSQPGGQLMGTTFVENWPGCSRILGPQLMHQIREHALNLGTRFIEGNAASLTIGHEIFTIHTDHLNVLSARCLIVALGASPKRLACPGEDDYWGKGVTTCAVCDGAFYRDKKVIIAGGGDSAMEDASFMTKFTNNITIVHILDKLTASHAMQQRVLKNSAISILYESTISAIKGNTGHVTHVVITNQKTGTTTTLEADGIFVAIGLNPNTTILKGHIELDKWGYIKITDQTKTSIEGIFAAGDVHDYRYRQAITAAGSGCMAALDAERYLSSNPLKKDI